MFAQKSDFGESDDNGRQTDGDKFNTFQMDRSIFTAEDNRHNDLHLQLAEKYMTYKDYAERCMTNPQHMGKEDNRVFYMRPSSIFLEEPRIQNQFRTEFIRQISQGPQPEPFTLMMDELHRSLIEEVRFRNDPISVKEEMMQFFKRRQYRLQHKRHKYIQRWSHFALTSELVDKVSLKFSPNYSKLQFELENAVKRWQRLEGEDHFASNEPRPQRLELNGDVHKDDLMADKQPKNCTLRVDDLDVYTRITGYEEKCLRAAEKFVNRAKWAPMSHRFDIYVQAQEYFQSCRNEALAQMKMHMDRVKTKAEELVERRKLGERGQKEIAMLTSCQPFAKYEKKIRSPRDEFMQKAKSNYDMPKTVLWNNVELKLALQDLSKEFGIHGDMELDNGNSFSYQIIVQFPTFFHLLVLKSQFVPYDAMPTLLHPAQLGKKNIAKVIKRNQRKYGKTSGQTTLLERIEVQKETEQMKIEYINQIERAIFGEFNNGQMDEVPKVRLMNSFWLEWVCFKPEIQKEQMHQAALLNGEMNPIDECTACLLEIVNINDVNNVNLTLESMSQIHCEKVKYGRVKTELMEADNAATDSYLNEQQKSFLSLFSSSLKTKFEFDQKYGDTEDLPKHSLLDTPQHFLFAHYLLQCLAAKEKKTKLLYTLNAFRAIQKRLTLELREFGSRDRVMGDCNIVKPNENNTIGRIEEIDEIQDPTESVANQSKGDYSNSLETNAGQQMRTEGATQIDNVVMDEMVDINRFRYNNLFNNKQMSTCPIMPKFHITYGMPIDRQEVSAEYEQTKDADPKKAHATSLLGRVDRIEEHMQSGCFIVTDDFGVNVMYDAVFGDMRAVEQEMLKIVSFYINKVEPIAEVDLRNIFPAVDRFEIINEVVACEEKYQRAKLILCLAYVECLEHTCDSLDQQRIIQIIVDLMARRPRLNLEGNHFRDSYRAETEALEMQNKLMREFISMQMEHEFKANNDIREYLEKTYQIIYQQIDNEWQYYPKADVQDEITKRRINKYGVKSEEEEKQAVILMKEKPGMFQAKQSTIDPKQFAEMLGIPYSSLLMLMKEHHERDPTVRQTLHEHTSFIKVQEGYPMFLYETAVKKQNKVKVVEQAKEIAILDFYESLAYISKIVSVCQHTIKEVFEVHRPDNGLICAALELQTFKFLLAELRAVKHEERGEQVKQNRDLDLIQDDSILGNSDKMLFNTKELLATISDPKLTSNPVVMTKLDLETIQEFDFEEAQIKRQGEVTKEDYTPSAQKVEESRQVEDEYADAYLQAMTLEERPDDDNEKKAKLHKKEKDFKYPRLKTKKVRLNIPSMLQLCCNGVEAMRMRHCLVQTIIQREVLQSVYRNQMRQMDKETERSSQADKFNLDTLMQKGEHWINFVDTGPGLTTVIPTSYSIKEFDPTLTAIMHFGDNEAFKALICPMGIEELRLVLRYELTNLSMLIVATRTNQILLDNSLRQLAEISMFEKGYAATAPAFDLDTKLQGQSIFESNIKRLPEIERSRMNDFIKAKVRPLHFSLAGRKSRQKTAIEKQFQKMRLWITQQQPKKDELSLRMMRTCRMLLCHDFLEELTSQVALDSLRLELLYETNQMRARAYLLPRDSRIHTIPPARNGEHQFAAYSEEIDEKEQQLPFLDSDTNRIRNFFHIPSFKEVLEIDLGVTKFQQANHQDLFKFNIFNELAGLEERQKPSLLQNDHLELLKVKLPKLTPISIRDADHQFKDKLRYVDFAQAFDLKGNLVLKYLNYFRNLQNLFDLEFFLCKLPSQTRSIAGLETNVASGLPFWEDRFEGPVIEEEDDYLENRDVTKTEYSRQNENFDLQYKNQVAQKIVDRIANEKRMNIQLMQELDMLKDRFNEWQTIMRCQELDLDITQASNFLSELATNNYYLLLLVLFNIQDSHGLAGTCQKEMHDIRHVVRLLTHQEDQKVTYTNGFHVNQAVTSTSRITLDENSFKPDYVNFFKSAQPVIDEEGLTPSEFNLLAGIYLIKYDNMRTYKKDHKFPGVLPQRDFHYLDCLLLNMDLTLRKEIPGKLTAFEGQAKNYAHQRLRLKDDKVYVSNASLQLEVFKEKKNFNKQILRSRQLRRCYLILFSRAPLPLDSKELKKLLEQSNEMIQWKVINKIDQVERARQQEDERNRNRRNAMNATEQTDSVKQIAHAIGQTSVSSSGVIQQYDQACCEVEIFQKEIGNYMIMLAKNLVERETKSLAKAFEMNGKRLEVLVHPVQQFASTFEQEVDKKSHLDIVNKVAPVQKMLTQLKNRCLEIETLTSGHGIVISSKDLHETLKELCRGIVQYGEIEMRTRCEHLYLTIKEYENQLYAKDRQLLTLEYKLKHAKEEINKIVNTKVFSRGNNLIYELDRTARQLRLIKDNIYALESGIKEKVRLYYEKDLSDTRHKLEQLRINFDNYRDNISANMKDVIHEKICTVEAEIKAKVLKDEQDRLNKKEVVLDKYQQMIKQSSTKMGIVSDKVYDETVKELRKFQKSEESARKELLAIQKFMRMQRLFMGFKWGIIQSKHDFKVENLQQQLTSNACLWEQLAEAEKREKILKQELEVSQHEIAMQEKMIDRLKEDIKMESREKQKLVQYKLSKHKRLEELEAKAREFEVLENVNLQKLLAMIEQKQKRIDQLEQNEYDKDLALDKLMTTANARVKRANETKQVETAFKNEAINKLLEMQHQKDLVVTTDEHMQVEYWVTKYKLLEKEVQELREENRLLRKETERSPFRSGSVTELGKSTQIPKFMSQNNWENKDSLGTEVKEGKRSLTYRNTHLLEFNQEEFRKNMEVAKQTQLPSILNVSSQAASQFLKKMQAPQSKSDISTSIEGEKRTLRGRNRSVAPILHKPFGPKRSFQQDNLQFVSGFMPGLASQLFYAQVNADKNRQIQYQNSVFNTFGQGHTSAHKKQASLNFLVTPIKPGQHGNSYLSNEAISKTQRAQPRATVLPPASHRSENLFNSLLETETNHTPEIMSIHESNPDSAGRSNREKTSSNLLQALAKNQATMQAATIQLSTIRLQASPYEVNADESAMNRFGQTTVIPNVQELVTQQSATESLHEQTQMKSLQ